MLQTSGVDAQFFLDSTDYEASLRNDWSSPDLFIVDLGLISPRAATSLTGQSLVAFGDPANAGVALNARVVEFIEATPTPASLLLAIESLLGWVPPALAELSDRGNARLNQVGAEASRLAAQLAILEPGPQSPAIDPARIRSAIHARRARNRFFPGEVFGEPAWDMLLDLSIAHVEARDVAVSSLCIAAAVPTTTALRWIRMLCDLGVFNRRDDPADARRSFISLSPSAATAMGRYLAAAP